MTPAEPTKVFAFINAGKGTDWVIGLAIDEHGECVGNHVSSCDAWSKHDMGATDAKAMHYPDYVAKYGEGNFVVEWVDDPRNHAGLMAAYAKNQARKPKTQEQP